MCGPARLRSDQGSSIVHWNRVCHVVLGRLRNLHVPSRLRMGDTFANPAFSIAHSPETLDSGTSVFDFGVDFCIGHVWQSVRVEGFATPAWSLGRVTSPAVHMEDLYSAFTYRFGVALAVPVGS